MTDYNYTDPRSGEAFIECDGCGRNWPASLTKRFKCPDCGRVREECPDCQEKYDA